MDDSSDIGAVFFVVVCLVSVLIFALIGRLIGKKRGRGGGGAAMGALLGPVGLVGAAFLPDKRRQCPACKGHVPDGARKCMHCGEDLPVQPAPPPPAPVVRRSVSEVLSALDDDRTLNPDYSPLPYLFGTKPRSSVPKKTDEELKIPCPLCGQKLRVSTLKQGENWCPHCFEKFIAVPSDEKPSSGHVQADF